MTLSTSDDSTVSAFLTTLSLEECSHLTLTLDLGMVPIHNTFPIDSTHASLLQNYPLLLPPCLDNLKHEFKQHQMEQYLIFDIFTGLMEYRPQKTWRYQFHPYTSLMFTSSSRRLQSHLVKLNDDIHKPHSDISAEHRRTTLQSFNNPISIPLSTIQ